MVLATWLAFLAAVSAAATWLALAYARRRNLVDQPGERRSHSIPTPRGGGIGITAALLIGVGAGLAEGALALVPAACLAGGLLLVAGIGWVDDHRPLPAWPRLAVQCLAGAILAWGLHGHEGRWEWALLVLVLVPVLTNVWNFMDGIDGLAATQAVLAAASIACLVPAIAPLALGLAAATAGFLPFNFPRARIFLGDVGSGTLGYALAALVGYGAPRMGFPLAIVLLLPLSAFLIDATLTLGARMLAGERWWHPHTSHLYQRWVKAGRSHVFVSAVYAVFSFVAIILALCAGRSSSPWLAGGGTVLWFACAAPGWLRMRRRLSQG